MKTYDYKWIDFLSGTNVLKVTNKTDFKQFKNFLKECGLLGILGKATSYEDRQRLAQINGKNENVFLFEYSNYKGITWSDNEKEAIDWYDKEPLEVADLKEFFDTKSEQKLKENESKDDEEIDYDYE